MTYHKAKILGLLNITSILKKTPQKRIFDIFILRVFRLPQSSVLLNNKLNRQKLDE